MSNENWDPAVGMEQDPNSNKNDKKTILLTIILLLAAIIGFPTIMISIFNIIPTIIYFFGIYSLKDDSAIIDIGSAITSYLGLLLLSCSFISISIFSSILSNNQVATFVISVFICFFLYFINEFADFIADPIIYDFINYIGIKEHYFSLNQGIISIKDLSYNGSVLRSLICSLVEVFITSFLTSLFSILVLLRSV